MTANHTTVNKPPRTIEKTARMAELRKMLTEANEKLEVATWMESRGQTPSWFESVEHLEQRIATLTRIIICAGVPCQTSR